MWILKQLNAKAVVELLSDAESRIAKDKANKVKREEALRSAQAQLDLTSPKEIAAMAAIEWGGKDPLAGAKVNSKPNL